MQLEPVVDQCIESNYAIINMRTSAGTYIKEFVHGDIGRTKPSLADFLGTHDSSNNGNGEGDKSSSISRATVQILQLDVSDVIL